MEGSCNCGSIRFHSSDNITAIVNCHCQLCRKVNGSAFSTYVVIPDDDFVLKTGTLKKIPLSKRATKSFCQDCGTPIYNQSIKFTGLKILYLGSLDTPIKSSPTKNIYCESQLSWVTELGTMQNFPHGLT